MPDSASSSSSLTRRVLVVVACAAAYGLFWLVGRPLLPATVQADRTVGLLPTLVVTAAAASLLGRYRNAPGLAFGIALLMLAVYTGLMRVLF